jgi:glycosyltransferase involved in cell wall biosynthesis
MSKVVSIILPYYNRKQYLKATLDSFEYYYSDRKDFQIVIVDDGSTTGNMPDDIIDQYNLWIKLIRIENKKGINPCYPYNVGVRNSDGDIIVLSSPEIVHTCNMFNACNDFEKLTDDNYLQFSVFCIIDTGTKDILLSNGMSFEDKERLINNKIPDFYENLGCNGYSFNNNLGSWYTHEKIKNDCFNFLSACTKDTYFNLSGFNEVFIKGTGFDDTDFRDRILKHVDNNVIWYNDFVAIHIDHPTCSNDNNTNFLLYNELKNKIYEKNDVWGLL